MTYRATSLFLLGENGGANVVVLRKLLQRLKGFLPSSAGRLRLLVARPSACRQEHLDLAGLGVVDFLRTPTMGPGYEAIRRAPCLDDLVEGSLEVGGTRGWHKSRRELRHGGLGGLDEVTVEGEEVVHWADLWVGLVQDLIEQFLDLRGLWA